MKSSIFTKILIQSLSILILVIFTSSCDDDNTSEPMEEPGTFKICTTDTIYYYGPSSAPLIGSMVTINSYSLSEEEFSVNITYPGACLEEQCVYLNWWKDGCNGSRWCDKPNDKLWFRIGYYDFEMGCSDMELITTDISYPISFLDTISVANDSISLFINYENNAIDTLLYIQQ